MVMQLHCRKPDYRKLVAAITAEYGDPLQGLSWVSEVRARQAEADRARLMVAMAPHIELDFKQTKPHWGPLSPGCRVCGHGSWSCLFINGKCNCRCFYCPTTQDEIGVPTTNRVPFAKAADYADYVGHFGFTGVSISGGEPLLTFDRTLDYLRTIRRKMGDGLHLWLYTNATLLTADHLLKLRDAGLNEIRMDISASDYGLKKAAMAVGVIPCVTVEIPAIPEDHRRLADLLPTMRDMGLNHLNLHQLRLTPHNRIHLEKRPYTFLYGEKITVLESEWMALALIQEACTKKIALPINYCAFVYKHRYQRAAARRRNALFIAKSHEAITENGYIRTLCRQGPPETMARLARQLEASGADTRLWQLNGKKDRLYFHPSLHGRFDDKGSQVLAAYAEATLSPGISYHFYFKEVQVNPDKRLFVEKRPAMTETRLDDRQRQWFDAFVLADNPRAVPPCPPSEEIQQIAAFEFIEPGLQDYGYAANR